MHSKKSMIRMLTRILYAGGLVLLVAGLLLSALSSPALASDLPALLSADKTETLEAYPAGQDCNCETVTAAPLPTNEPDNPSSLVFSSSCSCSCEEVRASVCNVGGDMKKAASWDLFFSATGNPADHGKVVDSGEIGPLDAGQCVDLSFTPSKSGNYAYKIKQEDRHDGPDSLWSNSCMVSGDCFPATKTSTPFQPATETPKFTKTPPAAEVTETETPTERPHMAFNLSAVCGYVGESGLIWKVANNTDNRVDYTWKVVDSDEEGSGTVRANDVDYFMTSSDAETVRIFVDDELVDTESSVPACKQAMELSFVCADDGTRQWYVTNPNDFAVDYTFELSTGGSGSGVAAASSTILVTTSTSSEEETLELTWTDTRPGTHTVSLTAPAESCAVDVTPTATRVRPTRTPTETETTPPEEDTSTPTPTVTNTAPAVVITSTPTSSPTATRVSRTSTPTVTNTPPSVVITVTPTSTNTRPAATATFTPTVTNTAPFVVITVTPTSTVTPTTRVITTTPPPSTLTNTPTVTNTAPFVVITVTPTTRVITATPPPSTLTPTVTNTAPAVVITTTPPPPPTITNTAPAVVITATPPPSTLTPTVTNTAPFVVITTTPPPTMTLTALPAELFTPTATRINTLAPPVSTVTTTPILIPVTGADMTRTVGVSSLALLGGMFTNTGLFMLGLALALTAFSSQMKD